ncbi:YidH family protein [Tautonia rosea]|uniref:YidH family protein n=1 Tax=Tautonia rosea TaxID=2728037 RepID=UPI001473EB95|nr:DUF202 domain-containing protein [Tautonia rosea]
MEEPTPRKPPSEIDPRVIMAAERTLLSWMRTGLALMGFGFVVARFGWFLREMASLGGEHAPDPGSSRASLWMGTVLVALGIGVLVGSAARYRHYLRVLHQGDLKLPGPGMGIAVALVLAVLGLVMLASFVSMGLLG